MLDLRAKYQYSHGDKIGSYSSISESDEILSTFAQNHNIIISWIYCNQNWGAYDAETGKWSGVVGQVNSSVTNLLLDFG